MEDMINIGNRIKERRKSLGLTQTDIFNKCGIASGALSKIENGSRTPSVVLFYKISQILNCDMEWLLTGISANKQNAEICQKEEILIKNFRNLSTEDQEEIMDIIELKLRRSKGDMEKMEKSSDSHVETA